MAHRHAGDGEPVPALRRDEQAGHLGAGDQARRRAEAERLDEAEEAVFAEAFGVLHADLDGAAVGGLAHDLADVGGADGVRVGRKRDHASAVGHAGRAAVVDGVRRDEALLERAGDGDDLEDRSRLIDVGDRAVALAVHRRRLRVEETVEVEGRPVREAEDTAGARLADDDDRALGIITGRGGGERLLAGLLDEAVDREDDGAAVDRRDLAQTDARELAVAAVAFGFDPALLAFEERIHDALDAGGGDALLVDVAQHVGGQLALGVAAAVFQFGAERLDAERLDALDHVLAGLAREDGPTDAVLLAGGVGADGGLEGQADLGGGQAEGDGDLGRALAVGLGEHVGVDADVPDVFGQGEQVVLRVADVTASARLLLEHATGLQSLRAQTRGVDPMQPDQPYDHGQEAGGDDPCQQTVARSPGVGQAHRAPGPPCPPEPRKAISRAVIRGLAEKRMAGDAAEGETRIQTTCSGTGGLRASPMRCCR